MPTHNQTPSLHNTGTSHPRICQHHMWPTNIHKLEMVQRRSARHIMHNYTRHASVTTMLQHLDLPTLQQRRQHSKIIMLYRIRHQLASIPTATYIRPSTRNTQHYILPYARTLVFQTSFFPSTIKIWNNLQPGVERSSSVVECRTRNREIPGSNPPLLPFRRLGIFRSLHRRPCSLSCINEYLAIDSGGNVSDLVLARNCCLARMLPGEAENGVGMNRSVREGKKCEALWAVQRTGYCAI